MRGWRRTIAGWLLAGSGLGAAAFSASLGSVGAEPALDPAAVAARFQAAYPEQHLAFEGGAVVFPDGAKFPVDDGRGPKSFADWLAKPDLKDSLAQAYPAGAMANPPRKDFDPGRARPAAFLAHMYGDCRRGQVERHLRPVIWLPGKAHQRVMMNDVNGAAAALEAVSAELDRLPASFDRFLKPSAGTFNCRVVAGSELASAHGYGIAIDLAVKASNYWRWAKPGPDGAIPYQNQFPIEIVRIFEQRGFIWGGRWYHYDTMHFEYRPELLTGFKPEARR